jgi:hypothetical protein
MLVTLLAACATRYPVRTDFDPTLDYSGYRSFALPMIAENATPDLIDNSLVQRRFATLFARALEGRGLAQAADPASADLLVRWWVTVKDRLDLVGAPVSAPYYFAGHPAPYYGGRWAPMYEELMLRQRVEGTLVLDLVDRRSGELVWRSYSVGTLRGDLDRDLGRLEQALVRALADYPPVAR